MGSIFLEFEVTETCAKINLCFNHNNYSQNHFHLCDKMMGILQGKPTFYGRFITAATSIRTYVVFKRTLWFFTPCQRVSRGNSTH